MIFTNVGGHRLVLCARQHTKKFLQVSNIKSTLSSVCLHPFLNFEKITYIVINLGA